MADLFDDGCDIKQLLALQNFVELVGTTVAEPRHLSGALYVLRMKWNAWR